MSARTRRGRKRRETEGPKTPAQPWSPGRRAFGPVDLLEPEQVETIHDKSLELLRDIGIEFMLPEAWDILERNGATVDRETGIARFDPAAVEDWIARAPEAFELRARNPERDLFFGDDALIYGSASSAPNVMDLDRGRRPGTGEDFMALVRLNHMLGTCGLMCGYPVEPIDRVHNTRHLRSTYDFLTLSDKAFRAYGIGRTRVDDALEMIMIADGLDRAALAEAPRTLTVLNVNSPLKVDAPLLEGSMELVRNGQIVVVSPVAFAGAMSPVTLSGSLIQHNAECLACIAFLQMVQPGAPVFYGSLITNVDLKSGAPAMGTPETVTGTLATGQLARRYNIPQRLMCGSTSNAVDAQAAYETMFSLWSAYLCGAHLMYHAHGWMEAGLTTSYEKTIVDAEMIRMMNALSTPIDLSDADEALAAIKSVGPGGHFFGTEHTLARYKTAFHLPILSDWRAYEFWEAAGAEDTAQRANGMWKELLAAYERPAIDPAREEALRAYVARREVEIGSDDV